MCIQEIICAIEKEYMEHNVHVNIRKDELLHSL